MSLETRVFLISNARGLHARASAKFAETVKKYDCIVEVEKDKTIVEGSSILGLLTLCAFCGTEIKVRAQGRESSHVLLALEALIKQKFFEEE